MSFDNPIPIATMNSSSDSSPPAAATAAAATSSTSTATAASSSSTAAAAASSQTIDQHLALTIRTLDQLTSIFHFPHHIAKEAIDECGPEDVTQCYNWILDFKGDQVEDGGGPVVPKVDCPHVDTHVKICLKGEDGWSRDGRMKMCVRAENDDGGMGQYNHHLAKELERYCKEGNLMTCECQFNTGIMTRNVSRKRMRSEDNVTGRLKCEEDYDMNNSNDDGEVGKDGNGTNGTAKKSTSSSSSCPPGENWLCLECGALLCSRYANGHAKLHYEDTKAEGQLSLSSSLKGSGEYPTHGAEEGHCIAVSLADLSVWCYECNAYLRHDTLDVLTRHLEELKFGSSRESSDHDGGKEAFDGAEKGGRQHKQTSLLGSDDGQEDASKLDEMEVVEDEKQSIDENNDEMESSAMSDQVAAATSKCNGNCGPEVKQHPSISKRKSAPKKLPPEQVGVTQLSGQQTQQPSQNKDDSSSSSSSDSDESDKSSSDKSDDSSSNNSDNSDDNDDSDHNSSSSSSVDDHQAALIASLLQSEHGDALRAYLSRHESFDTSNLGQCVPMPNLPKPPTFPEEMADFLRSPLCKSIVVLAGAGMSVSSGIPDFRSAGVGLYDTLRPELLTATELERALIEDDPTLALDKGMFLQNPLPMLETKRSFILGTYEKRWKATLAHRFVELLHTKLGKLTRLYTQNIDGLEMQTKLPKEKVVCVHGTMGAAACEECEHEVDFDDFCSKVRSNIKDITGQDSDAPTESTPIICDACENPTVKPTIVLFRGSMPKEFHVRTAEDLPEVDLLIIMGTSLTVAPANSLVYRIPPTALRMVMNNEKVGRRLGIDYSESSVRDVWAHGYTDETCLNLCEKMGWLDDLAETVDELPDSSAQLLRERLAQRDQEKEEKQEEEKQEEEKAENKVP